MSNKKILGEVIHLLYINLHAFCISIISKSLCNSSTSFPSSHGVFLDHPALFRGFVITTAITIAIIINLATRTASECVTGIVCNTNVTTTATIRVQATIASKIFSLHTPKTVKLIISSGMGCRLQKTQTTQFTTTNFHALCHKGLPLTPVSLIIVIQTTPPS